MALRGRLVCFGAPYAHRAPPFDRTILHSSRVAAVADRLNLEHSLWHLLTHTFPPSPSAPSPGDTPSERFAPGGGGGAPSPPYGATAKDGGVAAGTPTLLTARRTLAAVEAAAAARLAAAPPAVAALAPLDDPAYPAAYTAAAAGTAPTLDTPRSGEEAAAAGRLALAALQAVRAGDVAAAAAAARSVGGAAGVAAALLLGGVGGGAVATNGAPGGARASWLRVARKVAADGGGGVGPLERALLGVLAGSPAPAVAVLSDFEDLVWARLSAAVVTALPRRGDMSGRTLRGALRAAALGAVDGAVPLTGDGLRGVPGRGYGCSPSPRWLFMCRCAQLIGSPAVTLPLPWRLPLARRRCWGRTSSAYWPTATPASGGRPRDGAASLAFKPRGQPRDPLRRNLTAAAAASRRS